MKAPDMSNPDFKQLTPDRDLSTVPAEKRIDRADELLARLIDDIGTGPAFDRLRKDALRIKHVLRGLDW